jgi:hypothetical protein
VYATAPTTYTRNRNGVPAFTRLASRFQVACMTADVRTSASAKAVTGAGYRLPWRDPNGKTGGTVM